MKTFTVVLQVEVKDDTTAGEIIKEFIRLFSGENDVLVEITLEHIKDNAT